MLYFFNSALRNVKSPLPPVLRLAFFNSTRTVQKKF